MGEHLRQFDPLSHQSDLPCPISPARWAKNRASMSVSLPGCRKAALVYLDTSSAISRVTCTTAVPGSCAHPLMLVQRIVSTKVRSDRAAPRGIELGRVVPERVRRLFRDRQLWQRKPAAAEPECAPAPAGTGRLPATAWLWSAARLRPAARRLPATGRWLRWRWPRDGSAVLRWRRG